MNRFLIIPQLHQIADSIALAEEYGFGFEYNDFFFPSVLDDDELLRKIASEYSTHPLPDYTTAHGDFFDVILFSEDKYIREIAEKRIVQSVEAARTFGARAVVFHTNHTPAFANEIYVNNWYDRNEAFWRKLLAEYPDMNIYLENMCDDSPDMLAELAHRLSCFDNFGVCLDYAHAVIFGNDIDSWVSVLAPYVKHVHINDNDLKSDLHLAVGDGKIDWLKFREHYEKYFSDCTVVIETSSVERQRKSAEYLKKINVL